MLARFSPANLRAAFWALRALGDVRAVIGERGTESGVAITPPPELAAEAVRGVNSVLVRRDASCLERALVVQAWETARGEARDLIIGVTGPRDFAAHAWLDGEDPCHPEYEFTELLRRPGIAR